MRTGENVKTFALPRDYLDLARVVDKRTGRCVKVVEE